MNSGRAVVIAAYTSSRGMNRIGIRYQPAGSAPVRRTLGTYTSPRVGDEVAVEYERDDVGRVRLADRGIDVAMAWFRISLAVLPVTAIALLAWRARRRQRSDSP